ncbi:hypothetical protein GCM10011578_050220 [Streptomyces fuscichromogenes]|uniref:Transposase n=1 Tax=Streptomyces fuscichromogenes TaxID=1324013 RepID=A0A918CT41_9ACTN|nr:hypothetical protein GCM10011578_050220 [Streptomyces fuscichromogenes]
MWRPRPAGGMASKRIHDAEFREGARYESETRKSILVVAENLGIHPGTLDSRVSRVRRNG